MVKPSASLAQGFSNVGHAYAHILTILYPTVVLALEPLWGMSYGELIALMLLGQILFGVAALPAGWLGDRWSSLGMMVAFFIGTGGAAVLTGLARDPLELGIGLSLIGLFGSIYHPVGMAWLVRTAVNRGRALGANGMYGATGLAIAPLIAGVLTDLISWRAAFIIPGASCMALGVALFVVWRLGYVEDTHGDVKPLPEPSKGDVVRAFFVLSLTMTCVGLIGPGVLGDAAQALRRAPAGIRGRYHRRRHPGHGRLSVRGRRRSSSAGASPTVSRCAMSTSSCSSCRRRSCSWPRR